jgi:hypothetical protein
LRSSADLITGAAAAISSRTIARIASRSAVLGWCRFMCRNVAAADGGIYGGLSACQRCRSQEETRMADEAVPPIPISFVDNPHAPEVFASDISGLFKVDGNVALTLESMRIDHSTSPGPVNRVVIGRLVLTIPAAQRLAVMLNAFLEQQGYSPSEAMKCGQTAQ